MKIKGRDCKDGRGRIRIYGGKLEEEGLEGPQTAAVGEGLILAVENPMEIQDSSSIQTLILLFGMLMDFDGMSNLLQSDLLRYLL